MNELSIAVLVFLCLLAASLGSLSLRERLPPHQRQEDTHAVVGLMLNSAKTTFEAVDRNVHAIATDLILLERTLQRYGPDADQTRQHLLTYVKRAASAARQNDPLIADRASEHLLNDVGDSLRAIQPLGAEQISLWNDARQQFHRIVELRWVIVEQSDGTIPMPLIGMMVAWLVLIFGSFGYRAPRNAIVVTSFVLSTALIAGTIYLILDMDVPFTGPIQVSPAPLQRAAIEMQQR
jgi:hypothetical protein